MVSFPSQATASIGTGELYLRLQVQAGLSVVLPMQFAQEALIVSPQQFTLLPNQPAWALGLFNYRNRVIWSIDMPQFLEWDPLDFGLPEYHLVVMQDEALWLGLAVPLVRGVTRISPDQIQSMTGSPSELPIDWPASRGVFFSGQVMDGPERLWVLNASAMTRRVVESTMTPQVVRSTIAQQLSPVSPSRASG
ncbi:MAG: chemotaxis protein CheW [Thermostichus sp. BF3_bins_97]